MPSIDYPRFLIVFYPFEVDRLWVAFGQTESVSGRPSTVLGPLTTIVESIATNYGVVERNGRFLASNRTDSITKSSIANLPSIDYPGLLIIFYPFERCCFFIAFGLTESVSGRPSTVLGPFTTIVESITTNLGIANYDICETRAVRQQDKYENSKGLHCPFSIFQMSTRQTVSFGNASGYVNITITNDKGRTLISTSIPLNRDCGKGCWRQEMRGHTWRGTTEKADYWHRCLLRARGEGPRGHVSNQYKYIASSHWISSSAVRTCSFRVQPRRGSMLRTHADAMTALGATGRRRRSAALGRTRPLMSGD